MLKLKVIVGSTRPGRAAERVILWIVGRAEAHPAFDVEVLDLRDWPLPFFAENFQTIGDPRDPTYSHPIVKRWNQRIASGDVYLFVTPEYNHSMPDVLKNAIDSVFGEAPGSATKPPLRKLQRRHRRGRACYRAPGGRSRRGRDDAAAERSSCAVRGHCVRRALCTNKFGDGNRGVNHARRPRMVGLPCRGPGREGQLQPATFRTRAAGKAPTRPPTSDSSSTFTRHCHVNRNI